MICAFTGHRPEKLPWGRNERDERCIALKALLSNAIREAAEDGADAFACGMARGCDFYFAEAVLELGFPLIAYLPCPSQPDQWGEGDQLRYRRLLSECKQVYMVSPSYDAGCMTRRNRAMVDSAELLISVWDGSPGGTGATVNYAKRHAVKVIGLWR